MAGDSIDWTWECVLGLGRAHHEGQATLDEVIKRDGLLSFFPKKVLQSHVAIDSFLVFIRVHFFWGGFLTKKKKDDGPTNQHGEIITNTDSRSSDQRRGC